MHITQLKLLGFKSFVEPTDLIIKPGLTGVVGPNGCGKSNLLEALRWVMGETSYKAMRGGAMDDVIFSGTQLRPARNNAEVTITIDNRDRTAPAEFNGEEHLEIVRSIVRGDGSSYRVNGRDVRAKDIKLLFEDAATGARSHALVRQGQIGEIVNSKPQARRRILEDAAGIAGLHSRRHEAELRLSAAESNLERLADIMGQMDAQLNSLKRQARHAMRYKDLSEKLYAHEALLLHLKWQATGSAVLKAEADLSEVLKQVDAGTLTETQALTKREEIHTSLKPLREAEAEAAAALHRLSLARDGLEKEEAQAKNREAELKDSLQSAHGDLARDEHLIKDGEEISTRLESDIGTLKTNTEALGPTMDRAKSHLDECADALINGEKLFQTLSQSIADERAKRNSLLNDSERQKNRVAYLTEQLSKLKTEQAELQAKKTVQAGAESEDDLLLTISNTENSIAELEALLQRLDTELEESKRHVQDLRNSQNELALSLRAHETEIALLEKLLKPQSDTQTPVMEAIETKSGFEHALWAALGDELELPLQTGELDEETTSYWRTLKADAVPALPSGVKPLSDYVKGPQPLARRFAFVGVTSESEALALQDKLFAGQSLVSQSGGLWRWDGFVISPNAPSSAPQKLTERNRLPLLIIDFEALTSSMSNVVTDFHSAEVAHNAMEDDVKSKRLKLSQQQQELKQLHHSLRTIEQNNRQIDNRLSALSEGILNSETDLLHSVEISKQLETDITALTSIELIEKEHETQQGIVAKQREANMAAQLEWAGLQQKQETNLNRICELTQERESWIKRASDAKSHIHDLKKRIEKTSHELEQFDDLPAHYHSQRQAILDQISSAELKRDETSDKLAAAEGLSKEHEKDLRKLQSELLHFREEKARVETRLEAARAQLIQQARDIETDLNIKPEECLTVSGFEAAIQLPDLRDVEQDVSRFKKDRDRLGAVNLRAEDEIKELEETFSAMISERSDLESAVSKLRSAVNQLNDEGRQRLLKAFDEVNGHFKRLFQTLFAGGEAELKLIESDDPLEAGLEIIARPPGKKPQVLTLLSGGEKALTAMSLIFAVFLTNPSPICVLDEVDAPLDDTNVDRFCLMMEEMARSTDTRFLVITHHPMTMERMDRLFGVTMSEKGVSQLVSVDLATAEGILETA